VVQYPDINQRQSALDPLRNTLISIARFRLTAGMVVCQDDRSSVRRQSCLEDFARVD
jgi:hypothetical protein